jgi:hypothetical protein
MRGVDHQAVRRTFFLDQRRENLVEYTHAGPTYEPVIQRFMWPVDLGRIPPAQPIPDHMDDAADHFPIIHPRHTVGQGKIRFDPRKVLLAEPKLIRHAALLMLEKALIQSSRSYASELTGPDPSVSEFCYAVPVSRLGRDG